MLECIDAHAEAYPFKAPVASTAGDLTNIFSNHGPGTAAPGTDVPQCAAGPRGVVSRIEGALEIGRLERGSSRLE